MCGLGSLLPLKMRNMQSGWVPASSLNCPTIFILEFQSTGNESIVFTLEGPIYLLPQYIHLSKLFELYT